MSPSSYLRQERSTDARSVRHAAGTAFTQGTQSIHRAVALISAIARQNSEGARLSELAAEVGLNAATAHRILRALVAAGFVSQSVSQKVYRLGSELYALGRQAKEFDLRSTYAPLLVDLAEQTGDSAYLSVRAGHDAVYVEHVSGHYPIQALPFDVGSRWPLGIGAPGIAILAALSAAECERIIQINASRYPKIKGVTADEVRHFVDSARRSGYAYNHRRFIKGIAGISVPILDRDREPVAAVSVVAIASRLGVERRKKVAEIIKRQLAKLAHVAADHSAPSVF